MPSSSADLAVFSTLFTKIAFSSRCRLFIFLLQSFSPLFSWIWLQLDSLSFPVWWSWFPLVLLAGRWRFLWLRHSADEKQHCGYSSRLILVDVFYEFSMFMVMIWLDMNCVTCVTVCLCLSAPLILPGPTAAFWNTGKKLIEKEFISNHIFKKIGMYLPYSFSENFPEVREILKF